MRLTERIIKYEPIREVLTMMVCPLCLIVKIPINIKLIQVNMLQNWLIIDKVLAFYLNKDRMKGDIKFIKHTANS